MNKDQQLKHVVDHEGWFHGVRAAFKGVWGTDTEVRIQAGGMDAEIADAEAKIGDMRLGAQQLLKALEPQPIDDVEQALEQIIKDL